MEAYWQLMRLVALTLQNSAQMAKHFADAIALTAQTANWFEFPRTHCLQLTQLTQLLRKMGRLVRRQMRALKILQMAQLPQSAGALPAPVSYLPPFLLPDQMVSAHPAYQAMLEVQRRLLLLSLLRKDREKICRRLRERAF
ncbi:MAG: hypothetical protein ACI9R3_004869 [Verrucomicrobiales bacterium]|jgi:hypothetical protein